MNNFFEAFISYGRTDSKAFAIQLNNRLIKQGLNVWFDQDDIPLAVDFQEQINDGIEKADNFIFIIAPHSVNSPYCRKEIELALKRNKRIIPLLHVEEIDRETWQQRHPNGTTADWEADQAKGLHSSYPNMHPAIAKINWVYFREGIEDFEASLAGLLETFKRHQKYVRQHTYFLAKALEWERHQKQTRYLLIGEERKEAQVWLKKRFKDEQPPCEPTDLHCEFICESIKNANNLMTQVFLSHAEVDKAVTEKIRQTLMRESITVWTSQTDIKTGTQFQEEINRGIEAADNLVYLISPDLLQSQYCQQELDYALAHKKRIIPLLIEKTDLKQISPTLRALQFIDFTGHENEAKYRTGADKLLNVLNQDALYYEQHKVLLVKALKWQEQNRNPSILLQGYNLQYYEAWLKVAKQRIEHPPLPLQEEFIAESLRQPPELAQEVFVSYSRTNSDFARKLNEALQVQGKTTWFDQESIASGTDFQQEIYRGIENSDNFLFIISPSSVNSPYCADEVEYAKSLNKRIVTVLHRQVDTVTLHPALASIQWIDFNKHQGDFYANFSELVRTLDTDREHVHSHTKWLQRAKEWEQGRKNSDLLLRNSELTIAQNWLIEAEQQNKKPPATPLHKEFIASSKKAAEAAIEAEKRRQAQLLRLQEERAQEAEARLAEEKKSARRQKQFLGAVTIGLVVSTGLGIVAFHEFLKAEKESEKAVRESEKAKIAEIEAISTSSQAMFASNEKLDSLIKAIEAKQKLHKLGKAEVNTKDYVESTLQQAVYGVKEYNRLSGHNGAVLAVSLSPDGSTIASASVDNTVKLWQGDGTLLTTIEGHEGSVNTVAFSPDSSTIASGSVDNTVKLWQGDGTLLTTLKGHRGSVNEVAFSPDGSAIASASADQTVKLWQWDGKKTTLLAILRGENKDRGSFNAVAFSPNGQLIASGNDDHTIKIWKRDGTFLTTLKGHRGPVWGVAFSPNGQLIASASRDKTVKLWQKDGTLPITLDGHSDPVWKVAFSPDGQLIASVSRDKTVKLWQRNGILMINLRGHSDEVKAVDFSLDGQLIVSGSDDNSVRLWKWKPDTTLLTTLFGHRDSVRAVDFSPDGQLIASGSTDQTVKLWQRDGTLLKTLFRHSDKVYAVNFSPDGQLIASASRDKNVKLWQRDGTLLKTLSGHSDKVYGVDFSPDGQLIASGSADKTVKLWQRNGKLLKTLSGHSDAVRAVVFSPDGQLIASGSSDNTVKLWQRDGTLLSTLDRHKSDVFAVDISPDGQLIASGSGDNTVKLWKWDDKSGSYTEYKTLVGHSDSVLGVKFRPKYQMIASASVDNTIKIWKLDGTLVFTLLGHRADVDSIDFSPDGENLASGSEDRTVILWNKHSILNSSDLLVHGCQWARNYLKHNSEVEESERNLCEGIGSEQSILSQIED